MSATATSSRPGTSIRWCELGVAQTVVDVVAAQPTNELGQQVKFLDRAVSRTERTDGRGSVIGLDLRQTVGDVLQRRGPVDFTPLTTLLDHGLGQAVVASFRARSDRLDERVDAVRELILRRERVRRTDDADVEVEVDDHPLDARELLGVLATEDRDLRADEVQQLEHHGADADKKAGAKVAFQNVCTPCSAIRPRMRPSGMALIIDCARPLPSGSGEVMW